MGQARVDKLREEYDVEVEWHAFELHPGIPPEGQLLPARYQRQAEGKSHFELMAEEVGLEVGERKHSYNSDLAHEADLWARERGAADALHRAIYRAYFVEDRNIGSPDVLVELANGIGLDGEELRLVLTDRRYREAVLAEYAEAHEVGVTAVPTFVADNYAIVGAHPYESFVKLMTAVGQEPRET